MPEAGFRNSLPAIDIRPFLPLSPLPESARLPRLFRVKLCLGGPRPRCSWPTQALGQIAPRANLGRGTQRRGTPGDGSAPPAGIRSPPPEYQETPAAHAGDPIELQADQGGPWEEGAEEPCISTGGAGSPRAGSIFSAGEMVVIRRRVPTRRTRRGTSSAWRGRRHRAADFRDVFPFASITLVSRPDPSFPKTSLVQSSMADRQIVKRAFQNRKRQRTGLELTQYVVPANPPGTAPQPGSGAIPLRSR